jgi:CRISPR/Cas system CSM-associated protein Csm3 (group 7 of RAMP superfamily)
MLQREVTYNLKFRTPVSIFTGLGIAGILDRAILRTAKWRPNPQKAPVSGLPYIPGSSVKGRLRFFAERMVHSEIWEAIKPLHPGYGVICKDVQNACMICKIFGNASIPSLLRVCDAHPSPEMQHLIHMILEAGRNPVLQSDTEIRPGIALSRFRRGALRDHLFMEEAVPTMVFTGTMILDSAITEDERRFLRAAGSLVDSIGARKASGRGKLDGGIEIVDDIRKEEAAN